MAHNARGGILVVDLGRDIGQQHRHGTPLIILDLFGGGWPLARLSCSRLCGPLSADELVVLPNGILIHRAQLFLPGLIQLHGVRGNISLAFHLDGNQRIPVQVKRKTDISADTVKLNEAWQKKLRAVDEDSVWQYYQLISTQWPTKPAARKPGERPTTAKQVKDYQGSPVPVLLANIPTEVYNQDTSSCIVCHSKAFTTRGDYADFSFLLQFAK